MCSCRVISGTREAVAHLVGGGGKRTGLCVGDRLIWSASPPIPDEWGGLLEAIVDGKE